MVRSSLSINTSRPRGSANSSNSNNQEYLNNDCHRIYSCIHCRAHLANHDELISTAFQGTHGRAYLFNSVVNVGCGPAEKRLLMTGWHDVADIYCDNCKTTLGWKYKQAFEASQKYKEGKYIIELAHMLKENSWDLTSYNCKDILDCVTIKQEQLLRDRRRCPNYNSWPVKLKQNCGDDQRQFLAPPKTNSSNRRLSNKDNNENLISDTTNMPSNGSCSKNLSTIPAAKLISGQNHTTSNIQDIVNQNNDKKILTNNCNASDTLKKVTTDDIKKFGVVCYSNSVPTLKHLIEMNHNQTRHNQFVAFHVPTQSSEDIFDADHNKQSPSSELKDDRDSDLSSHTTTTTATTPTKFSITATTAIDIKHTKTFNNAIAQRDAKGMDAMNNLCDLQPHHSTTSTSVSSCSSASSSSTSSSDNSILSSSVSSTSSSVSTASSSFIQSPDYIPTTSTKAFQLNFAQLRQPC